ncbi:MAG: AEC family transporter [Oscillospiraceae bacterium]|nr:AEC family transporter [Oscillospiraceae bacterium]
MFNTALFQTTLINVVILLICIVPGWGLAKASLLKTDHLPAFSVILVYLCGPCLVMSAFFSLRYDAVEAMRMLLFFAVSLGLQLLFVLILYFLLKRKYDDPKYRVLTIGAVLGNTGFFGLPVITSLFPQHPVVACYSVVFTVTMNLLVFTIGVFCLTNDRKYMSLKPAVLNPMSVGVMVGVAVYLLAPHVRLSGAAAMIASRLADTVTIVSRMSTPLCMTVLGVRLADVPFRALFTRPFVYLTTALKLLVFPLFCWAVLLPFPLDPVFKGSILVLSSVPNASVMLSMAELHHGETELAANTLLVTTLLCFVTMPILASFLI